MKIKLPEGQKRVTAALLLALALLLTAFVVFAAVTQHTVGRLKAELAAEKESRAASVSAPMLGGSALYTLYECGGKIGIYDAKSGLLLDFVDVLVDTLPESDRLALKKGITLYSFSDLATLIEDFST